VQTMTTWKQRKKATQRNKLLRIGLATVAFFFGVLVGLWWNDQQSIVNQLTYDLVRTKVDLEKAKFELEKTSKISDVRQNMEGTFLKVLDLYKKYSTLVEAAEKNPRKEHRDKTKREIEAVWKHAFPPIKDTLTQLETMLANLENREPRNVDLLVMEPFIPQIIRR
jgi:hypothetical protein